VFVGSTSLLSFISFLATVLTGVSTLFSVGFFSELICSLLNPHNLSSVIG
jgi:hypothetical protein